MIKSIRKCNFKLNFFTPFDLYFKILEENGIKITNYNLIATSNGDNITLEGNEKDYIRNINIKQEENKEVAIIKKLVNDDVREEVIFELIKEDQDYNLFIKFGSYEIEGEKVTSLSSWYKYKNNKFIDGKSYRREFPLTYFNEILKVSNNLYDIAFNVDHIALFIEGENKELTSFTRENIKL